MYIFLLQVKSFITILFLTSLSIFKVLSKNRTVNANSFILFCIRTLGHQCKLVSQDLGKNVSFIPDRAKHGKVD